MTAFYGKLFCLGHIAQDRNVQMFLNQLFETSVKHRRQLVQDDPADPAVLPEFGESLNIGNYRQAHPFAVYDQHCRGFRFPCQFISACLNRGPSYPVVVSHDAFHDGNIAVLCVFLQQIAHRFPVTEKGIQVS